MTDEQIINAMLACSIKGNCPADCPYQIDYDINSIDGCMSAILGDALELIQRQRSEIEVLTEQLDKLTKVANKLHSENVKQKAEIEKHKPKIINGSFFTGNVEMKEHNRKIRAEAIKEFAEKLKDEYFGGYLTYGINAIFARIDRAVKEVAGEE